jgi:hypothetical protein
MRAYPAPGLRVKDPRNRTWIGEEGVEIGPHDLDLHRMLEQGDLVETAPQAPSEPSTAAVAEPAANVDHAEGAVH